MKKGGIVCERTCVTWKDDDNLSSSFHINKRIYFPCFSFLNCFYLYQTTYIMAQSTGLSSNDASRPKEGVSSPYMSNEPNSNVANFKIIESTLRGKASMKICKSDLVLIHNL